MTPLNITRAAVGAFYALLDTQPARHSVAYRIWEELAAQDRLRNEELHYGGARFRYPRAAFHFETAWKRGEHE